MGDAFLDVPLGPGYAYFAAVSLSHNENLRANFGSTPLRYPLEGFRPLQDPPATDVIKARLLFTYMDRVLPLLMTARHTQVFVCLGVGSKENHFIGLHHFFFHSFKEFFIFIQNMCFHKIVLLPGGPGSGVYDPFWVSCVARLC